MTFIHKQLVLDIDQPTKDMFSKDQTRYGYVPNYSKVFANRTDVMDSWAHLQASIKTHLTTLDYELIVLVTAIELRNSYCSLAHGKMLMEKYFSQQELQDIVHNQGRKTLTLRQQNMITLAKKVAGRADQITQTDIDQVKESGFSDEEVFDIVSAAAARCFFSKLNDSLGASPDSIFEKFDDEFKKLFVVGRPISMDSQEK